MVLLEFLMSENDLILILIIAVVVIFSFLYALSELKKGKSIAEQRVKDLENSITQRDTLLSQTERELLEKISNVKIQEGLANENIARQRITFEKAILEVKAAEKALMLKELEVYKAGELEKAKKAIQQNAYDAMLNRFAEWKRVHTTEIRQEAIRKSVSVNFGKVMEHFMPFHKNFEFNPKDARFLGSPIDLMVFDGISDEKEQIDIYFIEVKTGSSKLNPRQQKIRNAVREKNVYWLELNPIDFE